MENVTVPLAFLGGFLAFISPCCLPLYPSFISYITGISVNQLKQNKSSEFKKQVLLHSISFSVGLSIIYYFLGFSFSSIGSLFLEFKDLVRMLGGIFLVLMGLFLTGIFVPKFMMKEFRLGYKKKNISILNSFLVGIVFAAGWTPCIGPIFASIIYANIVNPTQTFINITAYSLGFCIPFVILGFFIGKVKIFLKYSSLLMKIGGILLIIIGLMVYFDKMTYLNIWTARFQYFLQHLF
ncbi:cytochrome c biogenesis CcdA family protein [Parageobacillus toebii]|uniref:cytochrome c biogenesis CcdA family protein n=1 Tax=Parageobacillus toebii TaxID=153151 RepID=UPI0028166CA3|nr:cytochrome c biogenesis protein CcdA [Parageobacillus toebii]WMT20857.1 cytochrome c biogenesis protein CcdA [Parageobacillus toebii]